MQARDTKLREDTVPRASTDALPEDFEGSEDIPKHPRCIFFRPSFFQVLESYGLTDGRILRWTKEKPRWMEETDLAFFVRHIRAGSSGHWTLVVADLTNKRLMYLDPYQPQVDRAGEARVLVLPPCCL